MNQQDAINKIQEFQNIFSSSNRVILAPKQMMAIGIGLLLVPVVEVTTQYWTFGYEVSEAIASWLPAMKGLFYGLVFWGIGRFFPDPMREKAHPIIKKAFGLEYPMVAAILAVAFGLSLVGSGELVYPLVFLLLGVFYNLLGRFSNSTVTTVSWLYILASPFYMYLLDFKIDRLWMYFMIFQGLTCLAIGYSSIKQRQTDVH